MRATVQVEPRFMSSPMDDATLTIGQLARQFGLNPSAIRYYERAGILPPPERLGEMIDALAPRG